MENEKFDHYAIIDLFGHVRLAGRVTEQVIGGCAFVRVDVPATEKTPAFTRLLGQGAIYSMNIVTKETADAVVKNGVEQPMNEWAARELVKMLPKETEPLKWEFSNLPDDIGSGAEDRR